MRMGGGKTGVALRLDSLNKQRGTAYDTSEDSPAYIENMSFARALDAAAKTNGRLANQGNPSRVTTCLARWEKICALPPDPNLTEPARRRRLERLFERIGQLVNHARVHAELSAELGAVFVAVEYISPAIATIHVPDGTFPFGTVAEGIPWSSTVAHVLVLTEKPAGYTEADFYEAVGKIGPILDAILPAWATWDWYRGSDCGPWVAVPGGPSRAGFYLDCPHNLDNQIFDV